MPRSVLIHGPCHVAASGKVSTRGHTVIRLFSSDGPAEIAACDAPPILVLIVVQDKRLHHVWVLLGYGIPAIKRLETGMITSRCYILELHAHLRRDNIALIIHLQTLTEPLSSHLTGEKQFWCQICRQSTKPTTWKQRFPPNRIHRMRKGA